MIGNKIVRRRRCVGSSIDFVKKNIETVSHGTVFFFDEYTFARGREGREWKIFPGQLVMTIALKPDVPYIDSNTLTMSIAFAIADALERYRVSLAWPNDFFVGEKGRGGKKVGGMLIEYVWRGGRLKSAVLGVAINCNNLFYPGDDLYEIATSLKAVTGESIDINYLRAEILASINSVSFNQ